MVQNQHERRMCYRCQRNVFPVRPKPNFILLVFSFFLGIPFLIYIIYYGSLQKSKCPICFSNVGPIDYKHPPFKGTPDSFEPSLIASGKVVRVNEEGFNPEGDFLEFIPNDQKPVYESKSIPAPYNFCKKCGEKIDVDGNFCANCGTVVQQ